MCIFFVYIAGFALRVLTQVSVYTIIKVHLIECITAENKNKEVRVIEALF